MLQRKQLYQLVGVTKQFSKTGALQQVLTQVTFNYLNK